MTTAEKLVSLRKEKGLSQLQLAEEINVSRQAISRWEVGLAVPSREKLRALSELYNVSVDYLLSDKTAEDMEKCMGVTEETQDIQTKKSFFGRVKGLTWERWQRIINAVTALGATVQACNRTLKAQPKAAVEKKKSIRVQLQEIKEKHGTRD